VDGEPSIESTSQNPWSAASLPVKWDVVVIGSGVGGLSAAAILGQLGKRVLVLEQHHTPGGMTLSFRHEAWSWDIGLHVVGEVGPAALPGRVLSALTGDRLQWTPIRGAYDRIELPDGNSVDIPGSLTGLRENLEHAFPAEVNGIRNYLERMRESANAMRDYFVARAITPWMRRSGNGADRDLALASTAEVHASVTLDPRLRTVLGLQWGFYGTPPSRSAFGVHALLARHFSRGAYYPRGGSMSIVTALAQTVAEGGGWTRVGADVEQILARHGRIEGVRLASGEEIHAPVVIGAAGAINTVQLLPEDERKQEWAASIAALPPSCGHICVNVGFRGDIRAAGASETNRWLVGELDEGIWDLERPRPIVYVSFPSLKDGIDHGSPAHHTAELVALTHNQPFARWAGRDAANAGPEYDALTRRISDTLLSRLYKRMPKLAPLVAYSDLYTPVATAKWVRGVRGASYGLELSRERFLNPWLRPRTPLRGLYLAGSDVAVVGIVGAMMGGLASVAAIDPERTGTWLRQAVARGSASPPRHSSDRASLSATRDG
jgi:all-trans-retinol 13,14-reductase